MMTRFAPLVAMGVTAACFPRGVYRVMARDAARSGEPVIGARFGLTCDDSSFRPYTITGADGAAMLYGAHYPGSPLSCRLQLRHRGYVPASVELTSICAEPRNGRCVKAEWNVDLTPAAGAWREVSAPHPMPACPDGKEPAEIAGGYVQMGHLYWQACRDSTLLYVLPFPKEAVPAPGAELPFAADEVDPWPHGFIGTESIWVTLLARKGDLETLVALRVDDFGAASIAWQSEPKPKGTLSSALIDLDGDGAPELRVRGAFAGEVSLKIGPDGRFGPWPHPLAGDFEGAETEVCRWFKEETGTTCDSILDLRSSVRVLPSGQKLLIVSGDRSNWAGLRQYGAVFLVEQGHARLLKSSPKAISFERDKPGCLLFDLSGITDRTYCLRDGALVPE